MEAKEEFPCAQGYYCGVDERQLLFSVSKADEGDPFYVESARRLLLLYKMRIDHYNGPQPARGTGYKHTDLPVSCQPVPSQRTRHMRMQGFYRYHTMACTPDLQANVYLTATASWIVCPIQQATHRIKHSGQTAENPYARVAVMGK
eukprot:6197002-Pleurochrysis_carterae.AAC.1